VGGISISFIDDQLVAIKRSSDPAGAARLGHEAAILEHLTHPGVVQLVEHRQGDNSVLITGFVGPETWADRPPATAREMLRRLAELSATVADLHRAGVAHLDLTADHVLIDAGQHPVLCGFGSAQPVNEERRQQDRQQLADLAQQLANNLPADQRVEIDPVLPALRDADHSFRQAIRILDDHATPAEPPRRWPTRHPTTRHPTIRQHRVRRWAVGAVVVTLVVALVQGSLAFPLRRDNQPVTPPDWLPNSVESVAATSAPATSDPSPSAPPATVINHNGRQYAVGTVGDHVVVGDWRCHGTATPAVLRPATGEVMLFDSWPEPGQSQNPAALTVVADAFEFVVDSSPCPELRVRTTTGSQLIPIPWS